MKLIKGMLGLGDNIYQRSFVNAYEQDVYLVTPWPELYADLPNVKCIRPDTKLRTQSKNISNSTEWVNAPIGHYTVVSYVGHNMLDGMRLCLRIDRKEIDLPSFGESPVSGKYVVVRPATVRTEWRAESRNPKPEYIAKAAQAMREKGYKIVSVADLKECQEWALEPFPKADITYHKGELGIEQLMALIEGAEAVIGGIGWILPASIAYGKEALIICGGQGFHNSPEKVMPNDKPYDNIKFIKPDNYCTCKLVVHDCDKEISNYEDKLAEWVSRFPSLV